MLNALRQPLAVSALLPASALIVAAVALYCIVYTALAGRAGSSTVRIRRPTGSGR